ncbi:phenylalanine--tRNA ligase beta subunit-related protein [Planococcus shenhongbingii]|uniref:Phenylalanine--tRNA ligase beta subunit-related protein n=1 Tax=Planococcus shenhongbingii TaxID=3058398 RepID=A0ABT8NHL5_9BACL|nr:MULTISPECIES: phenylalanine--tRNA ligase beta subunit-related protein [unclassified Planococcus (in: firmicutes)]MDN7247374.1 phenylalanine--tRNA ligase beta subunit-related protein [Planococcus sp. N017]WKA59607.1 phenylalanine--tRNA ligase beta subunit-related protein [Planococcus sp. N016]
MELSINPKIIEILPDFKIGFIHYNNITVSDSPQMLKGRLQLFQEQLYFDLEEKELTDFPGLLEWQLIWKALGADPSRYRPSAEALYRRIKKQNYLKPIHSAVDMNSFLSLQYEIPLGLYDADNIEGNVEIALGTSSDQFEGLNNRVNTLTNILVSKDKQGAFGSPYVDSKRTAVTEATRNALHIFYLRPSMEKDVALQLLTAASNMFIGINSGEAEIQVV